MRSQQREALQGTPMNGKKKGVGVDRRGIKALWIVVMALEILLLGGLGGNVEGAVTGKITGRVVDPTGAAVASATVRAVNLATGLVREATSGERGLFVLAEMAPGVYRLEVRRDGFQTWVREEVTVSVAGVVTEEVTLSVGNVQETVVVTNGSGLIERESAAVQTLIDRQFVANLPLNGRSFQTLLELTPGVVLTRTGSGGGSIATGQFSVNGQRSNANYFLVDGVSGNIGASVTAQGFQQAAGTLPGMTVLGGFSGLVTIDALQEFRVQTSSYAPEFGRMPGGQISVATRAGSNRFSGSLFHYLRNEALDAADWFDNRDGRGRRKLRQNDFGGTIGGPIRLPKQIFGPLGYDGTDRTFFFASHESVLLIQPQPGVLLARVPSVEARDRATGPIQAVLRAFPLPNSPAVNPGATGGDPRDAGRYTVGLSYPSTLHATSVRLDHHLNRQIQIFGRFNEAPSNSSIRSFPSQENFFRQDNRTLTLGMTWTVTPRLVSDLRFNSSQSNGQFSFQGAGVDGAILPPDNLIFPSFTSRAATRVSFQLMPGNFNAGISAGNLTLGKAVGNRQRQINIVENLTWVQGRHEWKFGFDYRRMRPVQEASDIGISYVFSTEAARASGIPNSITIQAFAPITDFYVHNFSGFIQDTFRIKPRVTLTYGARYEVNPPLAGQRLPYQIDGLDNPLTATLAKPGTRQWETTWNNIAPRVGLAWTLSEKHSLVLRAGTGLFYDTGQGTALRGYSSFPYNTVRTITNPAQLLFPAREADLAPPAFLDIQPPPYNANFFVFDRNLQLPLTRQWNVALEKGLGQNQSISVSYVGAQGRRLLRAEQLRNYNAAFVRDRFRLNTGAITVLNPAIFGPAPSNTPQAGAAVSITRNGAESDYHALQVQFRRRLARRWQAQASYTFAKSLDTVSDELTTGIPERDINFALERGPSDFDIRHNFISAISYEWGRPGGPAFVRQLLGGWSVDGIGRIQSARPFSVITQEFDILNISATRRVDLVPGVPVYLDDSTAPGGRRLNQAAFTLPAAGRQGTLGRNALRAFGLWQVDLALRRQFTLRERTQLQFRAEFFNLTNRPNFNDPASSFIPGPAPTGCARNQTTFGCSISMLGRGLSGNTGASQTSPSAGFNSLYQIGGPRSIQFSLKLLF